MKKTLGMIMIGALAASMATTAVAKREKKNEPESKKAVAAALKAAGAEHSPEKMKIREVGSVKTDLTYYHVYCGILKGGYEYHVIVFNNKQEYLGYYRTEYEPTGYEDGAILIDLQDGTYEKIRIEDDGPVDNTRIDGVGTKFKKVPEKKKVSTLVTKDKEAKGAVKPEFRNWTITRGSQKLPVRAIYVSQDFGKVTIRAEASGREVSLPKSQVSKEDREYIKQFE